MFPKSEEINFILNQAGCCYFPEVVQMSLACLCGLTGWPSCAVFTKRLDLSADAVSSTFSTRHGWSVSSALPSRPAQYLLSFQNFLPYESTSCQALLSVSLMPSYTADTETPWTRFRVFSKLCFAVKVVAAPRTMSTHQPDAGSRTRELAPLLLHSGERRAQHSARPRYSRQFSRTARRKNGPVSLQRFL